MQPVGVARSTPASAVGGDRGQADHRGDEAPPYELVAHQERRAGDTLAKVALEVAVTGDVLLVEKSVASS
jgi:hypothetical protein